VRFITLTHRYPEGQTVYVNPEKIAHITAKTRSKNGHEDGPREVTGSIISFGRDGEEDWPLEVTEPPAMVLYRIGAEVPV
jgi:hypothetical protein